jgi:hypothetical protein
MLDHVYSSQQSIPSTKNLHLFATDPPPIWRSEIETTAEMRDATRSDVKEETMLCTDSQYKEDYENIDWELERAGNNDRVPVFECNVVF